MREEEESALGEEERGLRRVALSECKKTEGGGGDAIDLDLEHPTLQIARLE